MIRVWLRALRVHHWMKNLLVFVALLASHRLTEVQLLLASVNAWLALGLLCSATYLLNDIVDLEKDRQHPTKQHRPLASGKMSKGSAVFAAALLLVGSVLVSLRLPYSFIAVLGGYLVLTVLYSLILKKMLVLDVLVLAFLFVLRLLAGATATGLELSFWLLEFAVLFFVGLALQKRYSELLLENRSGGIYSERDMSSLHALGVGSCLASIVILGLYFNSDTVIERYAEPFYLWLIIPVMLYWIGRIWLLAGRGMVRGDPMNYAAKDKNSWCCGLLVVALAILAK